MMANSKLLLILVITLFAHSCGVSKFGGSAKSLKTFTNWFTGDFKSEKLHNKKPDEYHDIRVHVRFLWEEKDDVYYYVEQALFENGRELPPYRQRVYRARYDKNLQEIALSIFKIDPATTNRDYSYKSLGPLKSSKVSDYISLVSGCTMYFSTARGGKDGKPFLGQYKNRNCKNQFNGANYVSVKSVEVGPKALKSHEQGRDNKRKVRWGPTSSTPYVFDRY